MFFVLGVRHKVETGLEYEDFVMKRAFSIINVLYYFVVRCKSFIYEDK